MVRQLIALMLKFPAGHSSRKLSLKGGTPKADPAAGLLKSYRLAKFDIRTGYLLAHHLPSHTLGAVEQKWV